MRRLRGLVNGMNAPRSSKWLIGIALTLVTLWLQAHLALAALRDDGSTLRNAIAVYNSAEVRAQVSGAADWVLDQGSALGVGSVAVDPIREGLAAALTGGELPAPASDAIVRALLAARDDAVAQFSSDAPTHALTLPVGSIAAAFGIVLPPEVLAQAGLGADISIPVISASEMDTWRTRYHWAQIIDRWGLLAALVAGVVGIVLARRPLRAFSIALVAAGALCLAAIPLFGVLQDWLVGGGAGAWGPLVTPLATSAMAELRPWLVPVGIAAIAAGAGLFAFLLYRERRTAASARPEKAQDAARPAPAAPSRDDAPAQAPAHDWAGFATSDPVRGQSAMGADTSIATAQLPAE